MMMKNALEIVKKEMGLTEIPPTSSPLRKEFSDRVFKLVYTPKHRNAKLEEF